MKGEQHRQCSCTDCLQSIGLDQMSAKHLNEKGSRIDKLYYGEYLPLRERKLLNKLVKTRAVYDDVRNEILPCTECVEENSETCLGEMDDGDKKHKHSGVRTIVDKVYRGEIDQDRRNQNRSYLKPKDQLNNIQISCPCGPRNADIINNHRDKPVSKIKTSSSSRLYAKRKQGDRSRKMRAVHFKTKYIRSDPCTCTTNLSENFNKRHSRLNNKKFNKDIESISTTIESKAIKAKKCVCECNITRKPNKSLQRLKNAKEKVRKSIRSSISKIENSFRIRKDSIMILRDKLMRKRAMKKYECEPYYCIPEESAPPKCYEKIKMRLDDIKSDIKNSYHKLPSISSAISFKTRTEKEKSVSKRRSTSKSVICTCEPELDVLFEENKAQIHRQSLLSKKIKMRLDDIKSDIKRSYHKLRSIGSGISFKTRTKKEKSVSKRRSKSKSVISTCEPELDVFFEENKAQIHRQSFLSKKIKMRLDDIKSDIKKSYHKLRSIGSGISFKTRTKKEKSVSKRKSKPVICTCEPVLEPDVFVEENKDKIHRQSLLSKKIKIRLDDIKSDIKKSYHKLRSIGSGISFKTRRKKEKSVSKRKSKSKPVICTCEPEYEPDVLLEENKDKIHGKPLLSKKRKDSASVKRNGLAFHIEPSVLSKKKSNKSIKHSTKPKNIKSTTIVCQCDKDEKIRKTSVLSQKSLTKLRPRFEYGRYILPPVDRTFPRVCEASICIPDERYLMTCAEILQAQSQLQDASEYSSTHYSQKGVGNVIATKSKHSQSQDMNKRHVESENIEPMRQAVRISSNFSFNIEFYKEQKNAEKQGHTQNRNRKHKQRDEKSVSNKTKYSSPRKASLQNKSVQSKIKQLTDVKTNYTLKRCFCALQLKDTPKSEKSLHCLKDKEIEPTTISECDCKLKLKNECACEQKEKKTTQTKKQQLKPLKEAFACGPYFDLDENCDNSLCANRVQDWLMENRKKRHEIEKKPRKYSKGTTSPHPMTKTCKSQCRYLSKYSFKSTDTKNINDQSQLVKTPQKERKEYESTTENASNRSVVRIGSSFSFDIQFYKENEGSEPYVVPMRRDDKSEYDGCKSKQKTYCIYKDLEKPRETCKKRKCRNKSTQSKLNLTDRFHSRANQGRFKIQKYQQVDFDKAVKKNIAIKATDYVCECDTNTQTPGSVAYVTSPLLPPIRTPVKCDDFTCKQNIKQHWHAYGSKNKKNNTVDRSNLRTKSTKTLLNTGSSKRQMSHQTKTPKSLSSKDFAPHGPFHTPVKCDDFTCKQNINQDCHGYGKKSVKTLSDTGSSKRQMSYQTKTPKSLSSKDFAPYGPELSSHRQAVSIGSSFSFNVEFYKQRSSEIQALKAAGEPIIKREDRNNNFKNNYKERKCKGIDIPSLYQREIMRINKAKNGTKESGIKPFLDKCFCTLKLFKGRKDAVKVPSPKVQYKVAAKIMKSRNCQCEIKRSSYKSIHKTKQICTPKVAYKSTSSGTSKSYIKKQKLQALQTIRPESVRERRISRNSDSFADVCLNEKSDFNKQVVRIGSSFSFNVEFYKDKGDAPDYNEIKKSIQCSPVKNNNMRVTRHEDRLLKHDFPKLMNDEAQRYDTFKCPERCSPKLNKIDRRVKNTPKTKNKSVITQEFKNLHYKNLLEICKCDKAREGRRKSYKHVPGKTSCAASGPEKMKSEIIGTDNKLVKCKTQKTQYNFHKLLMNNKDMKQPMSAMKNPTKQLVRIHSNFSFNIEFNKQQSKPLLRKPNPKLDGLKLKDLNKSEAKRNNLKNRQSMTVSKNGRSSNLALMLKHCLCSLKYQKQTRNGKIRNDNEKQTQLNAPVPYQCQLHLCEKYVTANRKQPKAKSVLDLKSPCLKTKKVQSSFREHEQSLKKYSDQNIKREKARPKHRLQKSSSKKAVRLGSALIFDIEFYKKYETPAYQDDRATTFKKLKRDLNDETPIKKIKDKRLYGSCLHRHREYQVGYMKEEVTAMPASEIQQQNKIWHMRATDENLQKTIQIVNPVLIKSNPFKRKHSKSNLRGKGKKKLKWRKKHVRFAISNIETKMKSKFSFKPIKKNKRFRSEICNTCFCNSHEGLLPKKSLLRAQENLKRNSPSRAFSSFNKKPKEYLNLQSKEKTSKLIESISSKTKKTRRNIFKNIRSKPRKRLFKDTQTMAYNQYKSASCKCNINRVKKKGKSLAKNVSHHSNLSINTKTQCKLGSRKSNCTYVEENNDVLKQENQAQPKKIKRLKIKGKKRNPQRIQQVFHMKNVKKKDKYKTNNDHNKHIEKISFSKGPVLRNNELGGKFTKTITNNEDAKKRSRILKSIMKLTILPNKSSFNGNNLNHIGKNIHTDRLRMKVNTAECAYENCKAVTMETIMPYRKSNFKKTRSRTCLTKECRLLIKTTAKKYNEGQKIEIDRKKTMLFKLSQRFRRKGSICKDVCLKRAKTNLIENTPNRHVKKTTFHVKQVSDVRINESIKKISDAPKISGIVIKKPCCVCCRRHSETDRDKLQSKAHDTSYVSKDYKLTNKKLIQKAHDDDIPKDKSLQNKTFKFFKSTMSCECGSKICKKTSKLWSSSLTPSIESKLVCLCHHKCECSDPLKKAKKKKLKKKSKKQKKQRKRIQNRKKQTSKRERKTSRRETAKLLKRYNETPDSLLLAESYLDLTNMSTRFVWSLMKVPYQVISDPKGSYENFKTVIRNPDECKIKRDCTKTAIGIQQKMCAMRVTKNAKSKLKSWTVTNYLIHAFDDDPKKRLQAIKSKRHIKRKERVDFECSPYMASLRNRPFLWVYDKFPQFYPQFISLLAGWRQFIDMLLFLSAIFVWSPCIFAIEMCRALVCCCLCTG